MILINYDEFEEDCKESFNLIKERFKDDPRATEALEWVDLTFRLNALCQPATDAVVCKECKYYAHDDFGTGEKYWCMHFANTESNQLLTVDEYDCCSFGERDDRKAN